MRAWETSVNRELFKWQLPWRRELFEWEKDVEQQLISLLKTTQWKRNDSDDWLRDEDDEQVYTVGLGYSALSSVDNFTVIEAFKEL